MKKVVFGKSLRRRRGENRILPTALGAAAAQSNFADGCI